MISSIEGLVFVKAMVSRTAIAAAVPHRANGMNHVFRRQLIAARDFGLTGAATFECTTFLQQTGARRPMDRTVDTAAAE